MRISPVLVPVYIHASFYVFLVCDFFIQHCVKSVRIRTYSGPHFPTLGLNTERHGISLRIQSKWGKMRTRITPNMDTFHAVQEAAEYRTNTVCLFIFAFPTSSLRQKCPNTEFFLVRIFLHSN